MKEMYTKPQADVEIFASVDVITTSATDPDDPRKPPVLPDL